MATSWTWISNWWNRQWTDIRGNLKWAFVYWLVLGGGMTWLAHHLQATLHANLAGWLALAAPIFSILAVAYLVVIAAGTNKHHIPAVPSGELPTGTTPPTQNALPEPPPPPKPVNLQGKILEIYIASFDEMPVVSKTYVAMKVQIVNHGPDEATIVSCGLHISLGTWQTEGEIINTIPDEWRIKKKRENNFLVIAYDEVPLKPLLRPSEVYKKGHPVKGWLVFELYAYYDVEFPNAQFDLRVIDSFDGNHSITRKPGVYPRAGELIRISKPAIPVNHP